MFPCERVTIATNIRALTSSNSLTRVIIILYYILKVCSNSDDRKVFPFNYFFYYMCINIVVAFAAVATQ
jgi:hypothetical protein